jgi:Uma2 family endonuclease
MFEILSPADPFGTLLRKLNDYASMGIPQVRVVDPEDGVWRRFEQGALIQRSDFSHEGMEFSCSDVAKLVR